MTISQFLLNLMPFMNLLKILLEKNHQQFIISVLYSHSNIVNRYVNERILKLLQYFFGT